MLPTWGNCHNRPLRGIASLVGSLLARRGRSRTRSSLGLQRPSGAVIEQPHAGHTSFVLGAMCQHSALVQCTALLSMLSSDTDHTGVSEHTVIPTWLCVQPHHNMATRTWNQTEHFCFAGNHWLSHNCQNWSVSLMSRAAGVRCDFSDFWAKKWWIDKEMGSSGLVVSEPSFQQKMKLELSCVLGSRMIPLHSKDGSISFSKTIWWHADVTVGQCCDVVSFGSGCCKRNKLNAMTSCSCVHVWKIHGVLWCNRGLAQSVLLVGFLKLCFFLLDQCLWCFICVNSKGFSFSTAKKAWSKHCTELECFWSFCGMQEHVVFAGTQLNEAKNKPTDVRSESEGQSNDFTFSSANFGEATQQLQQNKKWNESQHTQILSCVYLDPNWRFSATVWDSRFKNNGILI